MSLLNPMWEVLPTTQKENQINLEVEEGAYLFYLSTSVWSISVHFSLHNSPSYGSCCETVRKRMSLYHTAATILSSSSSPTSGGSLKSRIYSSNPRSAPQLYALISEVSKWDILLKEVIEKAGILGLEPKVRIFPSVLLGSTSDRS